jgi:hypothetical protein
VWVRLRLRLRLRLRVRVRVSRSPTLYGAEVALHQATPSP